MGKIDVAVKGIIVMDKKVFIVKRAKDDKVGAETWEFPGGRMEFGEGLEEALVREVKEEAGLDIVVEKLLYASTFNIKPSQQIVMLTYLCKSNKTEAILSKEHDDYRWETREQLNKMLAPEIIDDVEKNNVFALEDLT